MNTYTKCLKQAVIDFNNKNKVQILPSTVNFMFGIVNLDNNKKHYYYYIDYDYIAANKGGCYGETLDFSLKDMEDDELLPYYFIRCVITTQVKLDVLNNTAHVFLILNKLIKLFCGINCKDIAKLISSFYFEFSFQSKLVKKINKYVSIIHTAIDDDCKIQKVFDFIGFTENFKIAL